MNEKIFRAIVVTKNQNEFKREIKERNINDLPEGDVLINVKYSSLNYKDALSASGNKGITRNYPHTPGIDAAGVVVESSNKRFKIGDEVIVTSFDLGMNTSGGFAEFIRVPAEWIVKLPQNLSLKESMIYGTAGLTAGLSLLKLQSFNLNPSDGVIIITGATGGVGSMAVAILSKAGYNITAATGKLDKEDFLKKLGAKKIINREELNETSTKPLLERKWIAAVDTVGGTMLENILKSIDYNGAVASCGLVQSPKINTTVYPLILRGISLFGIDSVHCKIEERIKVWKNLAEKWKIDFLEEIAEEVSLKELNEKVDLILKGKITGRILVNPSK